VTDQVLLDFLPSSLDHWHSARVNQNNGGAEGGKGGECGPKKFNTNNIEVCCIKYKGLAEYLVLVTMLSSTVNMVDTVTNLVKKLER
jgi:hypothetical protein